MVEGLRDTFVENDVIGNFAINSRPLGSVARVHRRKKRKKHNKKLRKLSKKHTKRRFLYRKRKRNNIRSGKIKYTKRGQPYKIMPNGRAMFIKR